MQDIQKQTYSKLIKAKIYSEDTFCAKCITLDFMYQFSNPCIAVLSLTDILNSDNCIAKIGLKCIYGIVLAVQDYFKLFKKVIMSKFTKTLIDGVVYRIDDILLEDYENCMINIIQFIARNVDFNLIYSYFDLIKSFKFSNLDNPKNKRVFEAYCQSLREVCNKLMEENEKLFFYKLESLRILYESFRKEAQLQAFIEVIDAFFDNIVDKVYFISNTCKSACLENKLREEFRGKICNLEKEEINDLANGKVILVLDFEEENNGEMLYYLGKLEERLCANEMFLAIFYGCSTEFVKTSPAIKELTDRYIQGDNFEVVYQKIVKFINNHIGNAIKLDVR